MNQHGASRSIVVRLSASTLAVVALLGLTWFCAAVSADRLRASYAHTVNTIDALSGVVLQGTKLRDDEETGLRGYLLTGRQRFLQPYDVARRALPALRQRQDLLTAAEPAALPLVRAEWRAGDAWDRWATDVLVHPLPAPRGAAALIAQQDHGKVLFDRYRAAANRIIARLDGARQEDLRASVATSVMTDRLFAALFASAISLGLLLGWRAMRAVTRPLAALRRAAGAIGHGDLTQPVAIAGAREFVRLGAEMDAMRRQLQARADELAASEARFRALAEHGSDLVCVLAPDGGALYGSPSYARILGASIEDLHQAAGGPLAAIHPDDRAHVHAAMAACVTEGRPSVTLTCRHRHADGSWRTLECVATNRLTDPAVRGVIVTSRDVTARVEAEERLRASEERLRTLITHLPVILFALDADGVFTFSDGAGLATVGVAPDQVVGRPYRDVHAAHPEILEHLGRALVGEEVAFLRRVGERILDARATPLRDARGGVTGVIGVCVDVTDRVRAEEALAAERSFRDAVLDHVQAGIVACDAEGALTLFNRTTRALHGLPEEPLPPEQWADHYNLYGPDGRTPLRPEEIPLFRALRGEQVRDAEMVIVPTGAAPRTLLASGQAIRDPAGRMIGAVVAMHDITARKRMEAELERSNADLQQFAYVASHDLQEPLRTITSYLTLLQRRYQGKLGEDADEFIGFATDGAQRMSALIKAVLAYSRVGTHGGAFGPTDCGALVAAAVANLEARVAESGARVVYDALPAVHGDAAQLGQLFQNLIGNALKFTRPDTPPRVRVEAERQDDRWLVRVTDNGIGIAPAHAGRIFQMFGRLHTRTEYEGTGIGLAVCQRIVERHGGRIWVESAPGQGAAFLFTLPAREDRDATNDKDEREDDAA